MCALGHVFTIFSFPYALIDASSFAWFSALAVPAHKTHLRKRIIVFKKEEEEASHDVISL